MPKDGTINQSPCPKDIRRAIGKLIRASMSDAAITKAELIHRKSLDTPQTRKLTKILCGEKIVDKFFAEIFAELFQYGGQRKTPEYWLTLERFPESIPSQFADWKISLPKEEPKAQADTDTDTDAAAFPESFNDSTDKKELLINNNDLSKCFGEETSNDVDVNHMKEAPRNLTMPFNTKSGKTVQVPMPQPTDDPEKDGLTLAKFINGLEEGGLTPAG